MRNFVRSPIGISLLLSLALLPTWFIGLGEVVAHVYWNMAFNVVSRSASPSYVIVSVDGMEDLDTAAEAKIIDELRRQMPRRVFWDIAVAPGLNKEGDAELKRAVASFGKDLAFVVRAPQGNHRDGTKFNFPPSSVVQGHPIYLSLWNDNFIHAVISAPYSAEVGGKRYPTLSVALAGSGKLRTGTYYPDFSIDPDSISHISARALLSGEAQPGLLSGRTVIVTSSTGVTPMRYLGHNISLPVAHDVAGAEALNKTVNVDATFVPLLLLVLALTWIGFHSQDRLRRNSMYLGAVAGTVFLPVAFRRFGIVLDPEAAILYLLPYFGLRIWRRRTRRIQQTSVSGLPNFLALSARPIDVGRDVIVAVVARYEEILATLPQDLHGECATQIARRLSVGSGVGQIYHSDGGHFAWTEEARPLDVQVSHLEGLRALFSAPLQVGSMTFDTNIHFGLDRNEGLDALTRVNSALASANEGLNSGRAVEVFEAHRLAEAPWELSLHARIDEGLRNGDIWLAYQGQWDFRSQRMAGAEALIRWNHPTRGYIAPDQFILQAERAGRIDALTYWVLEEAITAAKKINALGARFQMSINLSAQMVDKPDLVANFREIVARREFDPALLTIEITETSSLTNRADAVANLTRLRELGFRLSIDDFGTGEASLAYLADLPSDELKIDRRFVSRLISNDRDRAIVTTTVALAHALGQVVVAEGVEDEATLRLLAALGCDHAQGFYLGRPQPFDVFFKDYQSQADRQIKAV